MADLHILEEVSQHSSSSSSKWSPSAKPCPWILFPQRHEKSPRTICAQFSTFPRKQKLGNAFRGRGEKHPELNETPPDTYSFFVHVAQQRELKDVTQILNRPFSASDRSLENVLQLVSHTWSEDGAPKFVWVSIAIGQLSCKAAVCVRGRTEIR